MASSQDLTYAEAAASEIVRATVKPLFILESDFFRHKPTKEQWITHVELYKAVSNYIPSEHIAGLQRVRGLWRIYLDDVLSRALLLTSDFALRGKSLTIYNSNPGNQQTDDTIRIRERRGSPTTPGCSTHSKNSKHPVSKHRTNTHIDAKEARNTTSHRKTCNKKDYT